MKSNCNSATQNASPPPEEGGVGHISPFMNSEPRREPTAYSERRLRRKPAPEGDGVAAGANSGGISNCSASEETLSRYRCSTIRMLSFIKWLRDAKKLLNFIFGWQDAACVSPRWP